MKYGLMYYKEADNIGDDIQTYAAKRFLPHIDYYVDRENLNCFIPDEKEFVSVIMNGWFLHNKSAWPPSPYINPLLTSMHFTSLETVDVGDMYLSGLGGDYLRKYEKIGVRDIESQKRLNKYDIKNYFSGCMTLTIKPFQNILKKDTVYVVDVDEKVLEKVKAATNREIVVLTHKLDARETAQKDIDKRMEDVENLLKQYQSAHVVITSRLHVALPCIALKTPVILVLDEKYEKDRLETYLNYAGNMFFSNDFCNMDNSSINLYIETPKKNNDEYVSIRNSLEKTCSDFIQTCENNIFDSSILPDTDEYLNTYVKNISWYKDLYENIRKKAKNNIYEYDHTYKVLNDEKENLYKQLKNRELDIEILRSEIERIHQESSVKIIKLEEENAVSKNRLEEIYNSRSWKIINKYQDIKRKFRKKGEK